MDLHKQHQRSKRTVEVCIFVLVLLFLTFLEENILADHCIDMWRAQLIGFNFVLLNGFLRLFFFFFVYDVFV